ncbi:hypothetical protein, conserved [Trypanosoma brucei brucei TREU927]|uniref:Uncharacterized protein n=2 Tax=Trypanozoon TaxID=39700 RepID=Q38FT5_TRYB2|nr:hypothetical protein, conserved [Trypanosoma brucei brucei TREU927]EAN76335.1 hypothetical protein, conserved [Trypanosoma brucei brucei TREU927]
MAACRGAGDSALPRFLNLCSLILHIQLYYPLWHVLFFNSFSVIAFFCVPSTPDQTFCLGICCHLCKRKKGKNILTVVPQDTLKYCKLKVISATVMLRRSFMRWISLAESRELFMDTGGRILQHPRATLAQTLQVLAEHHESGDATLTRAALQRLLDLDVTDDVTASIASFNATKSGIYTEQDGVSGGSGNGAPHLVLHLMQSHLDDATICEGCCRCVANMCQLASGASYCSSQGDESRGDADTSDSLVEQGAVELALGTLTKYRYLSPRGRAWAALAVLNLVCLSRDGARRAVLAGGESILSTTLLAIMEEVYGMNRYDAVKNGVTECLLSTEQRTTLDAALGAVARLLISSAGDNATGVSYRYEEADYMTVKAVVYYLFWLSRLILLGTRPDKIDLCNDNRYGEERNRESHDSSAICDTSAEQSGGCLHFPTASRSQRSAVLSYLPPLQKAWMSLKNLTTCGSNLPMVYEVLHQISKSDASAANGGKDCVRSIVEVVRLVGISLTGLGAAGLLEEKQLQQDLLANAVTAFAALTSTRKDLSERELANAAAITDVHCDMRTGSDVDRKGDGVSAVIPTEAAMRVIEMLSTGAVSGIALSAIHQIHVSHKRKMEREGTDVLLYDREDFELLIRSVQLLSNLSEEDTAVSSPNTLAVLHALLIDSASALAGMERKHREDISSFFVSQTSVEHMLLFQQCGIIAQVYAVLWGVLRTKEGARSTVELRMYECVERLQTLLESMGRASATVGNVSASVGDQRADCDKARGCGEPGVLGAVKTSKSRAAVAETIERLIPLGKKVVHSLELVSVAESTGGNKGRSAAALH